MGGGPLRAGAARVDITPPMGVEMCGYGPYEKRVCTEVLDPLYARALWLESAEEAMALVSMDLCTVDGAIRRQVAAELSDRCGMDEGAVMVSATHTHSGPAVQDMIGWGERDEDYVDSLPERIVEAVLAARQSAGPAKIAAGRRRVVDVGVNREQGELGPIDTAAQLMRVDREDGSVLAAVVNFGAHAVTRYPYTSRISADWPGLLAAYVRRSLGAELAMFLQGPCGNINPEAMDFDRSDPAASQDVCDMRAGSVAKRLGDQVLPTLKAMATSGADLWSAWRTVRLPCVAPSREALLGKIEAHRGTADSMTLEQLRPLHRRATDEARPEADWRAARFEVDACEHQLGLLDSPPHQVEAPIQALGVGGTVIVGWPGEVFVELGLELRQRSPFPSTFVVSLANDTVGYIPTEAAYESQGRPNEFGKYPTARTPLIYGRLPFRKDVGTILVSETLDLLNEVAGRRGCGNPDH